MTIDLLTTVVGQKTLNKFALHKMIESGGVIDCGLFGVRLSMRGGNFNLIEVITSGISQPIKYTMFNRPKIIQVKEEKKPKEIKEVDSNIKQEELI